ncbi:polysaccharide deacetylase family protein [Saccharibacillus sp. CPCC 101409]|uniref:polysaccharide deacetylase family protein n=1 Tax=Saccharibacillus sp. CPCC 101409 TaxID=3058041 RepID=UPI002672828A|nr:polysaccharide deacetylase family protein [Saccharibacillus sp. CPCC 101409]MDO3408147.1 polysaccharide deacetylase family protein [Saccharibacillus sp. CPCC 101409]
MDIRFNLFPGARFKALTFSYDDGRDQDRRLVEIFNRHNLKATFHLNSGKFGDDGYVEHGEVADLYAGHEISAHTVTHPFLERIPRERLITEIMDDRRSLEELAGYPVRGMSYPYGTYNEEVAKAVGSLGIRYSRTVKSTSGFKVPEHPLTWHPTCHHKQMQEHGESFLALDPPPHYTDLSLLYVWGHSYEFDNDDNWNEIEEFCAKMADRTDIWYATNIEIIDYLDALKRLAFSVDGMLVHNPSALAVWVTVNGEAVEIVGGGTRRIEA